MTLAREVTKLYEQFVRCTISEAIGSFEEPRGEFVLLFEGNKSAAEIDYAGAKRRMAELIESGMKRRQAAAQVAQEFGISRNEAYKLLAF
jgi:16S rRNA (cytidine1402-2'-O)-methyltransferase